MNRKMHSRWEGRWHFADHAQIVAILRWAGKASRVGMWRWKPSARQQLSVMSVQCRSSVCIKCHLKTASALLHIYSEQRNPLERSRLSLYCISLLPPVAIGCIVIRVLQTIFSYFKWAIILITVVVGCTTAQKILSIGNIEIKRPR